MWIGLLLPLFSARCFHGSFLCVFVILLLVFMCFWFFFSFVSLFEIYAIAFIEWDNNSKQRNILIDVFVRVYFIHWFISRCSWSFRSFERSLCAFLLVWLRICVCVNWFADAHMNHDCHRLWLRRNEELTIINSCEANKPQKPFIDSHRALICLSHTFWCRIFLRFIDTHQKKIKTFWWYDIDLILIKMRFFLKLFLNQ